MKTSSAHTKDLSNGRVGACFNAKQGARNLDELHSHPHFEMLYIIKGVRSMEFNGRRYNAKAGDLIVFKPGDEHVEFAGTKAVSYFFLRFKPEELAGARLALPEAVANSPVVSLPRKELFIDIFERMLDERGSSKPDSRVLQNAYLTEFVVKLRRAIEERLGDACEPGSLETRITLAMERIQSSIGGGLDLEKVARRSFMSPSYFSHSFKERFGKSPKSYQVDKRIESAQELLKSTKRSAMDIARELGYSDPYFFYRQFRRKTGMTPSEWRSGLKPKRRR